MKITLELTDEDLKKHGLQRIEKKGEFIDGESVWIITEAGGCYQTTYDKKEHSLYEELGFIFKTSNEIENHLAWLKTRAKIVRRIKELNDVMEWDWDDCARYYVFYDNEDKCLSVGAIDCYQEQPQEMYLHSRELTKQLIKELEPELKIYLGVI